MAKVYEVVAAMGEYITASGETKVRWKNCGSVIETEKGLSLKLECVPIGAEFDGWFKLFPPKPKEEEKAPAKAPADFNDDINF